MMNVNKRILNILNNGFSHIYCQKHEAILGHFYRISGQFGRKFDKNGLLLIKMDKST
jgi:hypothetical protein